jgi:hypothetical protein
MVTAKDAADLLPRDECPIWIHQNAQTLATMSDSFLLIGLSDVIGSAKNGLLPLQAALWGE